MILQFPDLEVLRLALTSGGVPPSVSTSAATAAFGDKMVWVQSDAKLSTKAQSELVRLGVVTVEELPAQNGAEYLCWPQIIPLRRETTPIQPGSQTPVLFELPSSAMLPAFVSEMLRLGNDRQGFRYLDAGADDPAVLLRVIGPPYYSLLQALDCQDGQQAPRAYLERAPRIWIEAGYTHPLLDFIKPPEDRLLLLRSPQCWWLAEDGPFHDIYEVLEFSLPHAPVQWQAKEHVQRLQVPLRLAASSRVEPAELWVLRGSAVEQLDALVRNSSDQLLSQLSFAVAKAEGRQKIVLRVRPSRQAAPILVLDAQPFRSYLRLPNLYVPCGSMLQPPLRRDALRRLLAEDPEQITWLYPQDDGTFVPESVPERAFRPLSEWVEYVLAVSRTSLQAWMDSTQFDFDRFICTEDVKPAKRPKKKEGKDPEVLSNLEDAKQGIAVSPPSIKIVKKSRQEIEEEPLEYLRSVEPNELQRRQQQLEREFLKCEGGLNDPARRALWPKLAAVYTHMENHSDATICWVNALWDEMEESSRWVARWHQSNLQRRDNYSLEQILDNILKKEKESSPDDVRFLTSCILYAARGEQPNAAVTDRLPRLQSYLHAHDHMLPVRAVWLCAFGLHRLSGGDPLLLARTRDRLLARLFTSGLTVEQDLPSFLRFTGANFGDRFKTFRDWLARLAQRVQHWLDNVNPIVATARMGETGAYANLILAFGLARLGEKDRAQKLYGQAKQQLAYKNDVHTCLYEAFGYRIEQAMQGSSVTGPLPADWLEYLEHMERKHRYMVERLRTVSRILEPHEKLNPYRHWVRVGDELDKTLPVLPDILEPAKLEATIQDLLRRYGKKPAKKKQARIVAAAVKLTPRVGQDFALSILEEVPDALLQIDDELTQANLLVESLFVAAHFDQQADVMNFAEQLLRLFRSKRFQSLFRTDRSTSDEQSLDMLLSQFFRDLRRMGLKDLIERLLDQLNQSLLQGKPLAKHRTDRDWPRILRSLLQLASVWFYFGINDRAEPILNEARRLLYSDEFELHEKRKLAPSYVVALGQAPAELALRAIDELLNRLKGYYDNFTPKDFYSYSQLELIEKMVLAILSEDFALGNVARRWLDDDEFLLRKRIHEDVHKALGET